MKNKFYILVSFFLSMMLSSCTTGQPTDEEVLQAINKIPDKVIREGLYLMEKEELYNQFAVKMVRKKLVVKSATVYQCVSAEPQKGYRCNIGIATEDIPILGGLAFDLQMRFSKEQEIWQAYIN